MDDKVDNDEDIVNGQNNTLKSSDTTETSLPILIHIYNGVKTFTIGREDINALDDINLKVAQGEFVALLGPSGSGKSTLMNVIGGLDSLTSGTALVNGEDILSLRDLEQARYRRKVIGFIFQNFNLESRLTARENVELPLLFEKIPWRKRKTLAIAALGSVGLSDRVKHKPTELSGGQQQRVAIARAIVNGPKILLADEPTGNLDNKSAKEIMQILLMLNSKYGMTIIMVTHNEIYARYAKRILFMDSGKIVGETKGGGV